MSPNAVCTDSFDLLATALGAAFLFFFPIGAFITRKARRNADGVLRMLLYWIAVAGVALAPLAAVMAVKIALEMLQVPLALADFVGRDDIRDIATGAGAVLCAVLAARLLLRPGRTGVSALR